MVNDDIDNYNLIKEKSYNLSFYSLKKEKLYITIPNMTVLECYKKQNLTAEFVISKELIEKTLKVPNEKYNILRFYFYFKNRQDIVNIENKIFVPKDYLPKEIL